MPKICLVIHDVRSAHNVGSMLRTADGLGVDKVYLTGYTPYPSLKNDDRLPHLKAKIDKRIAKTALGAEQSIDWERQQDVIQLLSELKQKGFRIAALEQAKHSTPLAKFRNSSDIALLVGSEIVGIDPEILKHCDDILEIPMLGAKESYNVAVAAAVALYHLRFIA